ncbi:uncharacterized protein PG998_010821 [Apiospora kogelbergensis]|uniref:uncharacterized protein n=1 Tax=Apiospora kogelbergensis TaxID=1337665 RepID=UPI00312DC292
MAAETPKAAAATSTTKPATAPAAAAAAAPPPPIPDHFPHPPQTAEQTPPKDGKSFYGYLIKKDRTPTDLLDALLRAVAKHIIAEIGDRNTHILDKTKLAAFYKVVGGDYDSLFVNAPDKSISYIWTALGVQHMLHPGSNDFHAPSVPVLTLKGFVRWESLQILLEPEEHVPFMQFAVRNWGLKHPDTGIPFPTDLPKEAFPSESDPYIDRWHQGCAEKLRFEAAAPQAPTPPQDPRVHFTHVRGAPTASARQAPEKEYPERERPSVPFVHVQGRRVNTGVHQTHSPDHRRHDSTSSASADDPAIRRKSFSDYSSPSPETSVKKSFTSSIGGFGLGCAANPQSPHSPARATEALSARLPPDAPPPPVVSGMRPHRAELRPPDSRRRSLPSGSTSPLGSIRQKLSSFLPGSSDRPHSSSRGDREKARPEHHSSRPSRSYSDESYASDSGSDMSPKQHIPRDHDRHRLRERDRERERDLERTIERHLEREHREREIEEERERRGRKDKGYMRRPVLDRRTSSAADVDRRSKEYGWEPRGRDSRLRDRERGRDRAREEELRRSSHSDDRERKRYRERERGSSPLVTGVGGRKYPG